MRVVRSFLRGISLPWLVAACCWVLFIWGNSLVPGSGSGELSRAVLAFAREVLGSFGLPNAWLTNFIMRKTAHFTEYAVLGILVCRAFAGTSSSFSRRRLMALLLVLAAVPSIDESIQLTTPDRTGQVPDVLLDMSGAITGALLCAAIMRVRMRAQSRSGLGS